MSKLHIDAAKNNALLDEIIQCLKLKNDAALSRRLAVNPPVISKIRAGVLPFGFVLIISAHEETGWPIADIKKKIGFVKGGV
ncbi:hypothetical protein ACO0LM_12080 [Undibacterium sp. Di26W]|uniref:hypothetical protein n=1 Tax=Undibacterium sp. Di26W TaxID=3413035 RepID=UPI003BF3BCFB